MLKSLQIDPQFGQFIVQQKSNELFNKSFNNEYTSKNKKDKFFNMQIDKIDCSKSIKLSYQDDQQKKSFQQKTNVTSKQSENKFFDCHCQSNAIDCFVCHGKKKIKENNELVKFFDFVLKFKLGKTQSYKENIKESNFKNNCPSLNLLHPTYKSSLRKSYNSNLRNSIDSNPSIISNSTINDICQRQKFVHQGFNCDQCQQDPIIGTRFHCIESCDDFDLCQKCYLLKGHEHEMKEYKLSGKYCQIKGVINSLNISSRIKKQRSHDLNQNFIQQNQIRPTSKSYSSSFY